MREVLVRAFAFTLVVSTVGLEEGGIERIGQETRAISRASRTSSRSGRIDCILSTHSL